ncbi:MAG: LLM class flavin-dependent oxidoreductase [Solirubrobacterales bacterium]|nr:LLM class flavin-dependent oxidoreductase [Solirubrobacterales bacterium]
MATMKVRIAVSPPPGLLSAERLIAFAGELERAGFDGIWLSDLPVGPALDPLLALATLAARTDTLHLGANVVPFGRSPFVLARTLAQLDQLTGGRLLLIFVTGLHQPGEGEALGLNGGDRRALLEHVLADARAYWQDGEPPTRPVQDPLEVWLGGRRAGSLRLAGRIADGWLGAFLTPAEAAAARARIQAAAAEAGREVDPEHFGMSIPYTPAPPSAAQLRALAARRPGVAPESALGVGRDGLRALIEGYVDAGLSKFVVRPIGDPDVAWLADAILDLQT